MKLMPLDDYGLLMTFEEFGKAIKEGVFTPDDGVGVYATATQKSEIHFDWNSNHPEGATHIVWYNK